MAPAENQNSVAVPNHSAIDELISYAELGYAKGFRTKLATLEEDDSFPETLYSRLLELAKGMRFAEIVECLKQDKSDNTNK